MAKERRVFTFEPGGGFTQVDEAPIASLDKESPKVISNQPDPIEKIDSSVPINTDSPENPSTPPEPLIKEDIPKLIDRIPIIPPKEQEEPVEDGVNLDKPNTPELEDKTKISTTDDDKPLEVPETDDFFKAAALRLKKSGALPENFELPENLNEDDADQLIYDAYIENLKPSANQELLGEFQTEMQKRGWTEQTLVYASLLENGVNPNEISQIQDYRTLSSVDITKLGEDDKPEYIRQMYIDRGWNEKEIKRAIDAAEIDDEIDNLATEASTYFGQRSKQYEAEQKKIAQQNQQQKEQIAQYKQAVISEIFNKKNLAGERFTEDQLDIFQDALYERTIPVQHEGQIYNLTPYEQFDSALNQDFALRLWAFKKWMFREQEVEQYKAEALREAEEGRIVKWGKRTNKIKGAPEFEPEEPSGLIKDTPILSASRTGGNSYVFENGELKPIPKK